LSGAGFAEVKAESSIGQMIDSKFGARHHMDEFAGHRAAFWARPLLEVGGKAKEGKEVSRAIPNALLCLFIPAKETQTPGH